MELHLPTIPSPYLHLLTSRWGEGTVEERGGGWKRGGWRREVEVGRDGGSGGGEKGWWRMEVEVGRRGGIEEGGGEGMVEGGEGIVEEGGGEGRWRWGEEMV